MARDLRSLNRTVVVPVEALVSIISVFALTTCSMGTVPRSHVDSAASISAGNDPQQREAARRRSVNLENDVASVSFSAFYADLSSRDRPESKIGPMNVGCVEENSSGQPSKTGAYLV